MNANSKNQNSNCRREEGVFAELVEIFSSLQGEGPYAGKATTFVRFPKCSFGCCYCDTTHALKAKDFFRLESPPRSGKFSRQKNPVSAEELHQMLVPFDDTFLSITGGEPLYHFAFLEKWLTMEAKRKILLETNGIDTAALSKVARLVSIISMDIKLPSSTKCKAMWDEHRAFLQTALAAGKEVYAKLVVTDKTTQKDIEEAIKVISSVNRHTKTVVQPASNTLRFFGAPSKKKVESIARLCKAYLSDVIVVPQMHKRWGIL